METHIRGGLLASLALHILPIGIWWAQAPYALSPSAALPGERVMEVRLSDGGAGMQTSHEVGLEAPAAPHATAEEPAPQGVQAFTNIVPIFPLKEAPYIPAGELDVRPSSESPVVIPFPDTPLAVPKVTGILVLYIGADGWVDRVEVDDSDLPPDFEKAAIDTFLQTRMQPGIKNGQASRARMKILVEFEQR